MHTFRIVTYQSDTFFFIILCVTLWAPKPPTPPGTYLYTCTITFLFYIQIAWDFFVFQRTRFKLQIETNFNILGPVEVLQNTMSKT